MIAVIVPGAMSYDASSQDQAFRNLTRFFGLYSVNTYFSDPNAGTLSDKVVRTGHGRPGAFCERSGNYFPQERLRVDGDGRVVGDVFTTSGTPTLGDDDGFWPGVG